jgi:hypothetical protein
VEAGLVGIRLLAQAVRTQLWVKRNTGDRGGKSSIWLVACEAAGWSILTSGMFAHLFWEKSFWLLWIMLAVSTQLYQNSFQNGENLQPKQPVRVRLQNPAFL